jgi:hypothetical protein
MTKKARILSQAWPIYHKDVSQKEIYKKFRNIFSPNLSFAIIGSSYVGTAIVQVLRDKGYRYLRLLLNCPHALTIKLEFSKCFTKNISLLSS